MQRQQEQNKRPVVDHIKLNIWYVKLYLYSPFFYYYMYMYMRFLLKFCVSFSACKYRIRRGTIGVEYGGAEGLEPPKRFYKGGSAPAEILLNLIAVTILANPKTLDVAKKRQHSDIVCLFH